MRFRMDNMDADESPSTIAYALIVILSAIYDFDIQVGDDGFEEVLQITDDEMRLAELVVSPAMGKMLVSILTVMNQEVANAQGGMAWNSQS